METLFPVSLDGLIIATVGLLMPPIIYMKAKRDATKMMEGFRNDLMLVVDKSKDDIKEIVDATKADAIQIINEIKTDIVAAPEILGAKLAESLARRLGGMVSGDSRLEKGLAKRMVDDFTSSQDPMVQMILGQAKSTLPYLNEHPELLPQVAGLLQRFLPNLMGKGNSENPSQNNDRKLGL